MAIWPTKPGRTVFVDGEECGRTGKILRVERGKHTINLGDPRNYSSKWRRPLVENTTAIKPLKVEFEKD